MSYRKSINPLGIAAFVLGLIALVFCWVPLLGLLTLPVSVIGVLLAVVGLVLSAGGKHEATWPSVGLGLSLLAIAIPYFIHKPAADAMAAVAATNATKPALTTVAKGAGPAAKAKTKAKKAAGGYKFRPGDKVAVYLAGGKGIWVAKDWDSYMTLLDAQNNRDLGTVVKLGDLGFVTRVMNRTTCAVQQVRVDWDSIFVRIEEGPDRGKEGWMQGSFAVRAN